MAMNDAVAYRRGAQAERESGERTEVGVPLPGDNRQRVADTTVAPSRWIGQLEADWPDGSQSVGTATLIHGQYLLTCAHNFYDTARSWHCLAARFRPGLNRSADGGIIEPYGAYRVRSWDVPEDYVRDGGPPPPWWGIRRADITRYLSDYAVGMLGRPVADPPGESMLDPGWPGDAVVEGLNCRINGYSGDLDPSAKAQCTRTGNVHLSTDAEFISYRMSTYNGDSGAGVFYQPPGRNYWTIIAVHVTGVPDSRPGANDGLNFGPSMSGTALDWVRSRLWPRHEATCLPGAAPTPAAPVPCARSACRRRRAGRRPGCCAGRWSCGTCGPSAALCKGAR
jgi:V8-like Glu-specific endopeptidase